MKIGITYERLEPTTVSGECLKVTTIYSSFNKAEIDDLEQSFNDTYKSGIILEVKNDD